MPDYERYLLERMRDGVTPQNNAATLIWPTLWPGELQPAEYEIVAAELGLTAVPSATRRPGANLIRICEASPTQQSVEEADNARLLPRVLKPPTMLPQFARADSEDKLVKTASFNALDHGRIPARCQMGRAKSKTARQTRGSVAPTTLLLPIDNTTRIKNPTCFSRCLLPGEQGSREVGRSLLARIMWNIGEHRPKEAWSDLLAIYRTGPLVAAGGNARH